MKTVLLEIINGPKADQKIWIRLGVSIKLGSGRLADLVINTDPALAPLHASINHRKAGCFLECIEPDGKVLINGKAKQRSRLRDGDTIVAGNTELKVSVRDDDTVKPPSSQTPEVAFKPKNPATANETEGQSTPQPASRKAVKQNLLPVGKADQPVEHQTEKRANTVPKQEEKSVLHYVVERCAGELWRLLPISEVEFPLSEAIRFLGGQFNCFLCIDEHVLKQFEGIESDVKNRHDLGDSLSLIEFSLDWTNLVLESAEVRQVATLIFSRESFETISHIIAMQSFSFRRPNIFATQIEVATPGVATNMMSKITCVLVADRSSNWKLYTTVAVAESWEDLGLPNQPTEVQGRF